MSDQLYNTPDLHLRMRVSAVAHIHESCHLYSDIITAQGENWEHYPSQTGTQGTWSNTVIVQVEATSLFCVTYIITCLDNILWSNHSVSFQSKRKCDIFRIYPKYSLCVNNQIKQFKTSSL